MLLDIQEGKSTMVQTHPSERTPQRCNWRAANLYRAIIINNVRSRPASPALLLYSEHEQMTVSRARVRQRRTAPFAESPGGNVGGNWSSAGSLLFNTSGLRPRRGLVPRSARVMLIWHATPPSVPTGWFPRCFNLYCSIRTHLTKLEII